MGWLKAALHIIGVVIEATAKAIAVAARWLALKAWDAIKFVGRHVVDFGRAVGHAFEKLWSTVIRPAIRALVQAAHDVYIFVRDVANKILNVLKHVYHVFDWIYNRYVRPLLSFIDQVRRILQLLAKLGVDWAGKLDAILGKVQLWIYNAFELVRSKLNELVTILNLVLDPRLFIRSNVFLASVNGVAGGVLSLMVHHGIQGTRSPRLPPADYPDPLKERVDFGGGVYYRSDEVAIGLSEFRALASRLL